jgi:hypothetical protein
LLYAQIIPGRLHRIALTASFASVAVFVDGLLALRVKTDAVSQPSLHIST